MKPKRTARIALTRLALAVSALALLAACDNPFVNRILPEKTDGSQHTVTVTFDKNGGDSDASPQTMKAQPGASLGKLPAPPAKAGRVFAGWNTQDDGAGGFFNADTPVAGDITVYAQWYDPQPGGPYTVTFNKNGGNNEASPPSKTVAYPMTTVETLPAPPARTSHVFDGWNTQDDGNGAAFGAASVVTGTITVYAMWRPLAAGFTVTFNKNGGDSEASPPTKTVAPPSSTVETLPASPAWAGRDFLGWNTQADGGGAAFTTATTVTADTTVYAQWRQRQGGRLTLYKDGAVVPGVTEMEQLIAWYLLAGNLESGADYIAELHADAVFTTGLALTGYSNVSLTLRGDGAQRKIKMGVPSMLEIREGITLVLDDGITLRGYSHAEDGRDNAHVLVYVNGGALEMRHGSEISGNTRWAAGDDSWGGGVRVDNGGAVTMSGGSITGNATLSGSGSSYGGGVFLSDGTFAMSGGTISGNNAEYGAGVYAYNGGAVTMSGGTISDNYGHSGGGVFVSNGTFSMSGGTVSGNRTLYGGGVYAYTDGTFAMSGGTVSGNTAGFYGGGIIVNGGTFAMSGAARADAGNDVYLYGSADTMTVGGDLSASPAATMRPLSYAEGRQVLSGTPALIAANYARLAVAPQYGNQWAISSEGKLTLTLAATRSVGGKITLSGGSGSVTQVSVQLKQNSANVGAAASPAADGTYAFANVAQGAGYTVEASLAGYAAQTSGAFTVANSDITGRNLTLAYILPQYTVTFDSNGGSAVPSQSVPQGGKASRPQNPTLAGSTFDNWYKEPALSNAWDFANDTVAAPITLYAKWNVNPATYTLSASLADGQNGRGSAAITTGGATGNLHNASVTVTATPTSGYVFVQWASNAAGTTQVSRNKTYTFAITANTALYAVFAAFNPKEMVQVAGGTFTMGSPTTEANRQINGTDETQHTVTVSGFYIGKYEVTQGLYREVMGYNPSSFIGSDNLPVELVTWYDAVEFCNKLSQAEGLTPAYTISNQSLTNSSPNRIISATVTMDMSKNGYRLPTEAEWEYAARGGSNWNSPYYLYAGSDTVDDVAWCYNSLGFSARTHEVGGKAANSLGIYDMSGNVHERCWDWYGDYPTAAQTDPVGASSGSHRVSRGGAWGDVAHEVRSAYRTYLNYSGGYYGLGFRLVRRP